MKVTGTEKLVAQEIARQVKQAVRVELSEQVSDAVRARAKSFVKSLLAERQAEIMATVEAQARELFEKELASRLKYTKNEMYVEVQF